MVDNIGNRLVSDLQKDFGVTKHAAIGIAANLAHESAGFKTLQEINPLVEGSRGGYGYAQWTGDRRKQFESWTQEQELDPTSYEANYGFLAHELKNTPEKSVLEQLANAETAEDATKLFSEKFLRPAIPHMDSRLERVKELMTDEAPQDKPSIQDIPFTRDDIIAELKKRGIETPQKETLPADMQFSRLEIERELLARGLGDKLKQINGERAVNKLEEQIKINEAKERNLPQRLYDFALKREKNIQDVMNLAEKDGVAYAAILPRLGETAAFFGDAGFEIIKTGAEKVSPRMVELIGDGTGWAASKVMDTIPAKFISKEYGEFKEKHPLIAENIEGGASVALFLSPIKAKGAGKSAKTFETAAENAKKGIRPPVVTDTYSRGLERMLKTSNKSYDELLDSLRQSDILTIADVAGAEVQGLTRAIGKMDGAKNHIHNVLTARSESAISRVSGILSQRVSNVEAYFGHIEEMAKARNAAARPLYKKAFLEAPEIHSKSLDKFLADGRIQDAILQAKKNYNVRLEVPNNSLEALDGAKKVLWDLESKAKRAGELNLANAYSDLRRGLVSELDEASASYKMARQVYEHPTKLIEAQDAGLKFNKLRPEALRMTVKGMDADALEAFRIGVRQNLQDVVSKTAEGADPAKRIFGNEYMREQLKAVFDDADNYKAFSKAMNDEIQAAKTKFSILGGSRTDYNFASDASIIDDVVDASKRGVTEVAAEKVSDFLVKNIKAKYMGISEKNAKDLAEALLGREKGIKALEELIEKQKDLQQRGIVGNAIKNHGHMTLIDE